MKKSKQKKGRGFTIFSAILCVLLVVSAAFFFYELYVLNMLPSSLLYPAMAALVLLIAIVVLLQMGFTKGAAGKIIFTLITCCALAICSVGGWYIFKANDFLGQVTSSSDEVSTTVQVIALKDSSLESEQDLQGKTLGVLKDIQTVATDKCLSNLKSDGVTVSTTDYDSVQNMAAALYDNSVPAIVLTQSSKDNLADLESEDGSENPYKNIATDTKVVYSYTYSTKKTNSTVAVEDITNTPFTVLISGSDSRNGFDEVGRSDVNMLMTVNPNTKVILLTSIPRDYYVETTCDSGLGCLNGQMDKLTHLGLHGTDASKTTIENLLGITINYTVKVNFNSVVSVVDALGGIEVTVEPGYAVSSFYTAPQYGVSEGVNYLSGEEALAYARERYAYSEGDRQRVKNQQQVLMSVLKKATSASMVSNYSSFLSALSDAFETDISADEIQKLMQFQIQNMPDWTFISYSLDGSGSTEYCAELGQAAYVMIPDENTVATAKAKIEAVINGESADQVEAIAKTADTSTTQSEEPEEVQTEEVVTEEYVPQLYYDESTGEYYYY
jgi:LCP family protein required for cell wall assembly